MKFDFTAAEQFLQAMDEPALLAQVLDHPAYQVVFEHARRYGNKLKKAEVAQALAGCSSRFYGLKEVYENRNRITALLEEIHAASKEWTTLAEAELGRLLQNEDLSDVTIYPIIGYDLGIGLHQSACLNLNVRQYWEEPLEFLYFSIHEIVHVLYERSHPVAPLAEIQTPGDWLRYFALWVQNEGFAVYAPLRLRQQNGHLADRDYQILMDPQRLATSLSAFGEIWECLRAEPVMEREDYLEKVFGDQRVTYRAGCEIFRRIECREGVEGVRQAFSMESEVFLARYGHLAAPHPMA